MLKCLVEAAPERSHVSSQRCQVQVQQQNDDFEKQLNSRCCAAGVSSVDANLETQKVTVLTGEGGPTPEELLSALQKWADNANKKVALVAESSPDILPEEVGGEGGSTVGK